jgi:hypothetical protein
MSRMAVCSVRTFLSALLFVALLGCFTLQVQVEVLCTVNVGTYNRNNVKVVSLINK